jgi:hypothetical protein
MDVSMDGLSTRIVYILRSESDPSRHYTGVTNNVQDRLEWHNCRPCGYTTDYAHGRSSSRSNSPLKTRPVALSVT